MILRLALLLMASAMLSLAAHPADKLTSDGIAEFKTAYQKWDGARFWNAAELFKNAAAKNPTSAVNHYWLGVARFHRMLYFRNLTASKANTAAADAEMAAAMAAFESALALDGHHAESHALLGTLYGMKIDGSMLRGMRYGPSVQEHQKQALKFGADNPRVRYLLGTGLFHTAKDAAGRRAALNALLAAEKLFAAEAKRPPGPLDPRWGNSSCLAFIGRSYASLGHNAEAAAYLRKALAEHPTDHIARQELDRVSKAN